MNKTGYIDFKILPRQRLKSFLLSLPLTNGHIAKWKHNEDKVACSDAVLFPFFQRWHLTQNPDSTMKTIKEFFILIFFNEWSHCKIEK